MEVRDILRKNLSNPSLDLNQMEDSVSETEMKVLSKSFLEGAPFAYLLGMSEFYYNQFYVNEDVLIPRPETEYLVDMIVQEFKGKANRVLDIGTGSGVILLSLLSHGVGKSGVGGDICEKALKVAQINTDKLGLTKEVQMVKSDRLQNIEGMFDLIVSNPPYIKSISQRDLVHDSVDKYEPHDALYLPDDYYGQWFEDFFAQIRGQLKGTFFMEGHELEVEKQAEVLGRLGFQKIQVLKDLTGVPRYLRAEYR